MTIQTFKALLDKLLKNQPSDIETETRRRVQLTIDLLGTETMSEEGMAIILTQVIIEKDKQ